MSVCAGVGSPATARPLDETYFLQRYTPRRPRSNWSAVKRGPRVEGVARLRPHASTGALRGGSRQGRRPAGTGQPERDAAQPVTSGLFLVLRVPVRRGGGARDGTQSSAVVGAPTQAKCGYTLQRKRRSAVDSWVLTCDAACQSRGGVRRKYAAPLASRPHLPTRELMTSGSSRPANVSAKRIRSATET